MLTSYNDVERDVKETPIKPPVVFSVVGKNVSPFVTCDLNEAMNRYDNAVRSGNREVLIYRTSEEGEITTEVGKPAVCSTCNQITR